MYQAPNTAAVQQGPTAMATAADDKPGQEHFDDYYEEVHVGVRACERACLCARVCARARVWLRACLCWILRYCAVVVGADARMSSR